MNAKRGVSRGGSFSIRPSSLGIVDDQHCDPPAARLLDSPALGSIRMSDGA